MTGPQGGDSPRAGAARIPPTVRRGAGEAEGDRSGLAEWDCRTAAQFTRHITTVLEDQTRAALVRYVGAIKAGELVDMARNIGQMKARYMAQALAVGTNRTPPSREDAQELRWMREQIEELEYAFQAIREAITNEQLPVGDIGGRREGEAGGQPLLRQPVI